MATNRGYGPRVKTRVWAIYGGTLVDPPPCHRCGTPANSVDHIVPVALGGTDELDNLRPACVSCNSRDGARLGNALKAQRKGTTTRTKSASNKRTARNYDRGAPVPLIEATEAPAPPDCEIPREGSEGVRNDPKRTGTKRKGENRPRLETPTMGAIEKGLEVEAIAKRIGLDLMPWQTYAAQRLLEETKPGQRRFRTSLVTVGRQNGKTFLLRSLVVWWLTSHAVEAGPQTVVHAANTRSLAVDQWAGVVRLFEEHLPGSIEKISRGAGRERLNLVDGSTYQPIASTDAVHGLSVDLFLVDEVWDIKPTVLDDGILPTTMARPQPLVAMFSTAGDENSNAMRSWRERGLGDIQKPTSGSSHLLLEWSAPDDSDPDDPNTWAAANPGMGRTIQLDALRQASKNPNRSAFYRANLNRWVQTERAWFPVGLWSKLKTDPPALDRNRLPVTAIEQDRTGGSFAIVTAQPTDTGRVYVTTTTAETESELWELLKPRIVNRETVLLPPLFPQRAPWDLPETVRVVGDREIRGWSTFVEQAVTTGMVGHDGSPLLAEQLGRTTARPRDGGLFIGTAVPGASVHAVRALVWVVAEATRLEKPKPAPVIRFA
ncbi:HNHc domain containing protein [uncultured Caudovirales phage]|uniref:HNHc domain containing protein n=1 Tax=uncultured Caudovirales phage TaxID=2100421 RepID=A0A6J5RK67_9CAUD|nr:HNHc domain containing protein [uncultured Caudovirales phage]CAB4194716.1 HNHc domain containing protein [uncultured Caudovirales phage]